LAHPRTPTHLPGYATVPRAASPTSNDRLRELYEAVVAISTELELPNVMQHIVSSAKRLAGADYAALGVLDESGTELSDFVYEGIDPELAASIGHLPEGRGILGELIRSPRTLRLDDLTHHPKSCGFPPGHPPMRVFLGVPISIGGRVFGNLYLTEKSSGGSFSEEDETVVMMLANAAATAIQNARLYERSTRHRRWLEATTTIITHLLRGARSEDVLTEIAQVAHQMAGADECGVRLADRTGRSLRLTAAAGTHSSKAIGEEMPIQGTFLGAVFATGTSSSTSDLATIAPADTLVVTRGVGPVLAVALRAPERTLGTLSLSRYRGRTPFDPSDLELVESFAAQAGLALAFGEAHELHERMALNDDRERIARDLHDRVIQRVFAAGLTLQATASMLEEGAVHDRVTHVVEELDDTIAELRTTIFALQQSDSRSSNLRLYITELVQRSTDQLGFSPRLRITGEIGTRVGTEIADHLLAVLREAISNVARHADATRLNITIAVGGELRLQVDDDGRGLPDDVGRRSGLKNLEERATALGGTSRLERSSLGGTRLSWTVPLDRPNERASTAQDR
jgi:signal transduction histidine kinase